MSRIDFLLKVERIGIEVKFARPSPRDKAIGDELPIDIVRYKAHDDCRTLVCFVYDREYVIRNPVGLERDLASHSDAWLPVVAVIAQG